MPASRKILVGVLLLVAGAALWWGLSRSLRAAPVLAPTAATGPAGANPAPAGTTWYTPLESAKLEVSPLEMSRADLESYIASAVELAVSSELSGDARRAELVQAVSSQIVLIATGSFDDYVKLIHERKGELPFNASDEQAVLDARGMFRVSAAPIAGKRFSVDSMLIRKHDPAFAWAPTVPDAPMVVTANRSRYPLTGLDDETEPGDCFEFVFPIQHEFNKDLRTILLGVRFLWSPASGKWIPVSQASYGGTSQKVLIFPPL